MYTIIGCNNDNDISIVLGEGYSLAIEAEIEAKLLMSLMTKGELQRENGEPIDWIEICYDYNGKDEATVWSSHDISE